MKKLVIYPGRFQPFHKGHAQVYQWLKNKFGDAVIGTSDKVEAPKSPFNFKEKKQMMRLAGVPAGKIKQVLNPYMAREILKDFDPKTTVLIFAVSQKDMDEDPRFSFKPTQSGKPGYLQPYAGNEKNLKPFGDVTKMKGYVIVTPTFTFDVLGQPATSASELRKQFVSLDNKTQKEFIKDLFGKYDESVHKLMKDKLPKPKTIKQLKEEITRKQLAPMLDSFVSFASDKLGLKSMPTVRYKTDDDDYNSFAAYNPSSNELSVHTMNRHPMDIFRSVAHELVHHKQNEDGKLGKDIEKEGATGSDIENEANSEAGKIMRWFAKANPDMFGKSFVVENSTTAMGGIRGLGNVTGEVSPTGVSQYVIDNQSNTTDGLWNFTDPSWWMNSDDRKKYHMKTTKGFKALREQLTEGINDPGRLKAVFLAGGPGSGKDFVMNKALAGNGLREINSDTAFEFLMKRNNLDLEMPDEERVEREIVRGRAKNITSRKEINSLSGRLGLIVNGTADDLEKIKTVKAELEDLGYDTMMVFVNTSNEVSRQRNVERGKSGNRKVPDGTDKQGNPDDSPNIRQEKWDLAQENLGELEKIFGKDSFTVIDNTADIRKVAPDVKERIEADFNRVRRMTMQFVQSPVKNKRGQAWTQRRARYQGTTQYAPPKAYTRAPTPARVETPKVITKPSSGLMDQARRLGLSYYGFGRFGRKVNGVNKVMYHSKGDQLVRVQPMNEEKKMKNPCWKGYRAYGMKKKNGREVPNCVPVSEGQEDVIMSKTKGGSNSPKKKIKRKLAENLDTRFETFMEEHGAGEWGTPELTSKYMSDTPGQREAMSYEFVKVAKEKKKSLTQEDNNIPRFGLPIGGGLGDEITQYRPMTVTGFTGGFGSLGSIAESIQSWVLNPQTQQKFTEKYGEIWEEKLIEAAIRLEEAGCGCNHSGKKSVKRLKEGFGLGYNDMGTVPTQRKQDGLDETSKEDIIDTSKIKSLKAYKKNIHPQSETEKESLKEGTPAWQKANRRDKTDGMSQKAVNVYRRENPGSKLKTAVTEKNPTGKRANRRTNYCSRSAGQLKMWPRAARDPNSGLRRARRRWRC